MHIPVLPHIQNQVSQLYRARACRAPAGVSPSGVSPAGRAPAGASPAGRAPAGVSPAGRAPAGLLSTHRAPTRTLHVGLLLRGPPDLVRGCVLLLPLGNMLSNLVAATD